MKYLSLWDNLWAYGANVPFHVVFLKGKDEIGSTPQGESLSIAKAYAISHFPIQRMRSGATEAHVRNEAGIIVFRHPDA